jgi:tungstate transport system permease protein
MSDVESALLSAVRLVFTLDRDLAEIIGLSMRVSLSAVAVAALIGVPLGGALALLRFPGRKTVIVLLNAFMGLPPVVVGLAVYLMLSRLGPMGVFGLLYSPAAMIIAQSVLVTPIVAALSRQVFVDFWSEYEDQLRSLGAGRGRAILTLAWDARSSLVPPVLAGFGRATAEVGAVMIVGGNIDHVTRVMTTTIALETSKGNLAMAMGLGIVLVLLSLAVNASVFIASEAAARSGR